MTGLLVDDAILRRGLEYRIDNARRVILEMQRWLDADVAWLNRLTEIAESNA